MAESALAEAVVAEDKRKELIDAASYRKACIILDKDGVFPELIDVHAVADMLIKDLHIRTIRETKELLFYYDGKHNHYGEIFIDGILVRVFSGIKTRKCREIYNASTVRKEIIERIKAKTYTRLVDFDADLNIINMANGLYDIQSGAFMEHDPSYPSLIQIPVVYDPAATCPNIDKMIETVAAAHNRTMLYEFIVYCLHRKYPIQKILVLLGPGQTGKSYFMDVVKRILGIDNCSSVSIQELAEDKYASSDLHMKMANICGDLDASAIKQAGILKKLTSNKDTIRAQRKHERSFDFVNYAKLIYGANQLPPSNDATTGFYRRFDICPFLHIFKDGEDNQEFLDSLTSESEISGLFNKVVGLLPALLERGKFTNALSVEETRILYETLSSPEEAFFTQFVMEEPGRFTPKDALWVYYREYCKELSIDVKSTRSKTAFGRYITQNIEWIKRRAIRDDKEGQASNFSTRIDGKSTAAWPDTYFDLKTFNNRTKPEAKPRVTIAKKSIG